MPDGTADTSHVILLVEIRHNAELQIIVTG